MLRGPKVARRGAASSAKACRQLRGSNAPLSPRSFTWRLQEKRNCKDKKQLKEVSGKKLQKQRHVAQLKPQIAQRETCPRPPISCFSAIHHPAERPEQPNGRKCCTTCRRVQNSEQRASSRHPPARSLLAWLKCI